MKEPKYYSGGLTLGCRELIDGHYVQLLSHDRHCIEGDESFDAHVKFAEHLIHCANMHDELLREIKHLFEVYKEHTHDFEGVHPYSEQIAALIAKAEGGKLK